jgi:hypothetical protein
VAEHALENNSVPLLLRLSEPVSLARKPTSLVEVTDGRRPLLQKQDDRKRAAVRFGIPSRSLLPSCSAIPSLSLLA